MEKIIEAKDLPNDEKVYLKKDFLGWRVVAPPYDPETGKINWFNFLVGGKKGLAFLIIVLFIFGLVYFGVNEIISQYQIVANNPCDFCRQSFVP